MKHATLVLLILLSCWGCGHQTIAVPAATADHRAASCRGNLLLPLRWLLTTTWVLLPCVAPGLVTMGEALFQPRLQLFPIVRVARVIFLRHLVIDRVHLVA